jgi:hypothetical protein
MNTGKGYLAIYKRTFISVRTEFHSTKIRKNYCSKRFYRIGKIHTYIYMYVCVTLS